MNISNNHKTEASKTQTKLAENLHSAAKAGKVDLVRLLLRCGANVNAQDEEFGNTPLHQAAWNGFSETVQVLCKHRADTSLKNKAQFTALHMACQQGHNQCARLLLMASAKSESKNSYGDTPLHTAARYGHAGVARILLSAKCNPNQVNKLISAAEMKWKLVNVSCASSSFLQALLTTDRPNHDTPLHISAAMGRRKLTKIFMQNGAEPAIKNKQDETPMDIALRKNLIDIQELIANPPPAPSKKLSREQRALRRDTKRRSRSHQHERYGQLYASFDDGSNRSSGHLDIARKSDHQPVQHTGNPNCPSSGEDDDQSSHLAKSDELARRLAGHLKLSAGRSEGRLSNHLLSSSRHGQELPVDVPPFSGSMEGTKAMRRFSTGNNSTSLSSLALRTERGQVSRKQQHQHRPLSRHLRHKTLTCGSKANLLFAMEHHRVKEAKDEQQNGVFKVAQPVARESNVILAPDAREVPAIGNNGITSTSQPAVVARSNNSSTPVIKEASLEEEEEEEGGISLVSETSKGRGKKRISPTGSLHSSQLSKSRGRLLIRRRGTNNKLKSSLILRRPALGQSCVGKLSLLRLRSLANKRSKMHPKQQQQPNNEERQVVAITEVGKKQQLSAPEYSERKLVATGRRQERLMAAAKGTSNSDRVLRAPNGTRLLATRPLALLTDETQLYAIPHKSKQSKQQVQVSSEHAVIDKQEQHQQPVRVPSGGPALTSDGCQSSSGSSSSLAARATPLSHTTGERPAVVGVVEPTYVSSPGVPGYSSITLLNKATKQQVGEREVAACSCGDDELPLRVETSRQQQSVAFDSTTKGNPWPSMNSCKEAGKQMVGLRNEATTTEKEVVTSSKTGKFRSIFQLRDVSRNNKSQVASERLQSDNNVSQQQQTNGSSSLENGMPADHRSEQGEAPGSCGYFAYSPVVQSSSELVQETIKSNVITNQTASGTSSSTGETTQNNNKVKRSKKSWLKSKFSLSTSNIQKQSSKTMLSDESSCPLENNKDKNNKASEGCLAEQHGPERKAELIRINCALTANSKAASSVSGSQRQKLQHHIHPTITTELPLAQAKENVVQQPSNSAVSSSAAELIAAHKTLAAAAAAKVKRDRLVRLAVSNPSGPAEQQETRQARRMKELGESATGMLSVKTGSHPLSSWINGSQHGSSIISTGGKYLIGQPLGLQTHHRSGSNSVGMSDSSPSNNGADSDNSLQTNSGSLNTDSASANGQPAGTQSTTSTSSPLGMLSRILLNQNSGKSYAQKNSSSLFEEASQRSTGGSSSRLSQQLNGSGSAGSSALSSPGTGSSADTNEANTRQVDNQSKLDQLSSRSRCPIVISKSNELSGSNRSRSSPPPPPPARPPPLPAKSALKPSGLQKFYNINQLEAQASNKIAEQLSMNGLPRVSSYTQISSSIPQNGYHPAITSNERPTLCNYHALTRAQLAGAPLHSYATDAYLPNYAAKLRYSHEPAQLGSAFGLKPFQHPHHHMSHHDLRSIENSSHLEPNLPPSALNYEYYLEGPTNAHHPYPLYLSDTFRYSEMHSACQMLQQQQHPHNDSVYIPASYTARQLDQIRDNSSSTRSSTAADFSQTAIDMQAANKTNFVSNNSDFRQRPKSSLDTILLSSSKSTSAIKPTTAPNSNGLSRQLSATATTNHNNSRSLNHHDKLHESLDQKPLLPQRRPKLSSSSSSSSISNPNMQPLEQNQSACLLANLPIQSASQSTRNQPPRKLAATYYPAYSLSSPYRSHQQHTDPNFLYSTENTIYASDQHSLLSSDLTVLPEAESGESLRQQQPPYQLQSTASSTSVKVLAEGGSTGCNSTSFVNASICVGDPGSKSMSLRKQTPNSSLSSASAASSVSSSTSTSPAASVSPSSPPARQSQTSSIETANSPNSKGEHREASSRAPTHSFKSLVQVNMAGGCGGNSPPTKETGKIPVAVSSPANSNQSSKTSVNSPLSHLNHLHNHHEDDDQQIASDDNQQQDKNEDGHVDDNEDDDDENAKKINSPPTTKNVIVPTYLLNGRHKTSSSQNSLGYANKQTNYLPVSNSAVKLHQLSRQQTQLYSEEAGAEEGKRGAFNLIQEEEYSTTTVL